MFTPVRVFLRNTCCIFLQDLLYIFGINSLLKRRNVSSLSFVYEIINHFFKCPDLLKKYIFFIPGLPARYSHVSYFPTPGMNLLSRSHVFQALSCANNYGEKFDIFVSNIEQFKNIFHDCAVFCVKLFIYFVIWFCFLLLLACAVECCIQINKCK